MSTPGRAGYTARQAQLLHALLRGDDYPEGFVVAQADAAGRSLRRKRARAALRRRSVFVAVARLRRPYPRLLVVARLPWAGPVHGSLRLGSGADRAH